MAKFDFQESPDILNVLQNRSRPVSVCVCGEHIFQGSSPKAGDYEVIQFVKLLCATHHPPPSTTMTRPGPPSISNRSESAAQLVNCQLAKWPI